MPVQQLFAEAPAGLAVVFLGKQGNIPLDGLRIVSLLRQLLPDALQPDLVELVQDDEHVAVVLFGKAGVMRHAPQDMPVADMHGELPDADLLKNPAQGGGGGGNQLDLRHDAVLPQNVDIALGELAEAPLLGPVRPPYAADLQRLEGHGQLVRVVGVIPGQGHGQVVPQAGVARLAPLLDRLFQLLAPLLNFKNQLFIFAALLAGQVFDMLHGRRFNLGKAVGSVGLPDHAHHLLAKQHIRGQTVPHALDRRFDKAHLLFHPFLSLFRVAPDLLSKASVILAYPAKPCQPKSRAYSFIPPLPGALPSWYVPWKPGKARRHPGYTASGCWC